MHYYQFHISDFRAGTVHLSRLERWIYRDLLDVYYDTEKPLPLAVEQVCRLVSARTEEEVDAVRYVLAEKFCAKEDGHHHERCEKEFAKYQRAKANHWGKRLTKAQRREMQAARNAAKLKAMPGWLTREDKKAISVVYAEAALATAQTGVPHDVDHIMPLRGKALCGLHVPWNLQVLPAHKNREKSNLVDPF